MVAARSRLRGVLDAVQGNLMPQEARSISGPDEPWWEAWGWKITWKVLLTAKGNSRKWRDFLRTERKAGIYSNQFKMQTIKQFQFLIKISFMAPTVTTPTSPRKKKPSHCCIRDIQMWYFVITGMRKQILFLYKNNIKCCNRHFIFLKCQYCSSYWVL